MAITPGELYGLDDKALLERMGGAQVGSPLTFAIEKEFERRALVTAVAASNAQLDAARYAKATAIWTKRSAIAIAASVVVMALPAIKDLIISLSS